MPYEFFIKFNPNKLLGLLNDNHWSTLFPLEHTYIYRFFYFFLLGFNFGPHLDKSLSKNAQVLTISPILKTNLAYIVQVSSLLLYSVYILKNVIVKYNCLPRQANKVQGTKTQKDPCILIFFFFYIVANSRHHLDKSLSRAQVLSICHMFNGYALLCKVLSSIIFLLSRS